MYLLATLFCILAYAYHTRKRYPKVKGVFSQDHGLWFGVKYVVALVLLSIRSAWLRIARRFIAKHRELERRESPDDFVNDHKFANTWALIGGDKHGNVLLVRMCRRLEGRMEIWLILRLSDGRTFTHPVHPDTVVQDETPFGDEFENAYMAGAGMRLRVIEPVKKYRFAYAGLMRLHNADDATLPTNATSSCVEVDIRVWFKALADPAELGIDGHPAVLAWAIANEDWSQIFKFVCSQIQTSHYQQAGEMRGFLKITNDITTHVEIPEKIEATPLTLYGMRVRKRGRHDWSTYHRYLSHFGTLDNGVSFSLSVSCSADSISSHFLSGFIMKPNGFVYAVSWSDIHLVNFPDWPNNLPIEYEVNFMANGEIYHLRVSRFSAVALPNGEDWQTVIFLSPTRFDMNGIRGSGSVEYAHKNDGRLVAPQSRPGISDAPKGPRTGLVRNLTMPSLSQGESVELCLSLEDPLCCFSSLTGGKSAKLAMMLQATRDVDFMVPAGFALTTHAFGRQLGSIVELGDAVAELIAICGYGEHKTEWRVVQPSVQKMQASCDRAVSLFKATPLIPEVKNAIRCYMEKVFGPEWQSVFVAVRSSAVGEDGAEASAAGQMETYLHIQGEQAIEEAIRKCWASNFDFRALQYRRKICGKLDPSMGVLIQRLVPAETAGVMFTRDPTNGSMARMIINASFGVGEDVVSGVVEPDTITVHRHDFIDPERLDVVYTHIGSKRRTNSNEDNHLCCLSQENVQRLAKVGVVIERMFGSARDIEWAIAADEESAKKGLIGKTKIHILQARPITTMDAEEDWELEHEFDSPLGSGDYEWLTTANVQEMMPSALTPLSCGIWPEAISSSTEDRPVRVGVKPWRRTYVPRAFTVFYQHAFFNYTLTAGSVAAIEAKHGTEMAIFGELNSELPSLDEMQCYIDNTSTLHKKCHHFLQSISAFYSESSSQQLERQLDAAFAPHATQPEMLYQQIVESLATIHRGWRTLLATSSRPFTCQIVLLSLINRNTSSWSTQDVSDLSVLMSTCSDVFTGDVPTMMRAIAVAIAKVGYQQRFLEMNNTTAVEWLNSDTTEAIEPRELLKKFLKKHGHRCVCEVELREKTWRQQPEKLVEAIKAILSVENFAVTLNEPAVAKRATPVDEAIESLSRPVDPKIKKVLRWLIPIARRAVGRREWGKSLAIRSMEGTRIACHRLGVLLAQQGILPDEDLVFFFSLHELGNLIRRRSPKLIFKALRRRRLHERLMKLEFDEIIHGYPEPVTPETNVPLVASNATTVIKGIPVGTGSVEGTARVLLSFEQAHEIKNGEILVVPYTDVGWTPYFSLTTGLVTELGGLLSHGAVIAREYGLPCLVGCKRATKIIPNGARIRIDCKTATLVVIGSDHKESTQ